MSAGGTSALTCCGPGSPGEVPPNRSQVLPLFPGILGGFLGIQMTRWPPWTAIVAQRVKVYAEQWPAVIVAFCPRMDKVAVGIA